MKLFFFQRTFWEKYNDLIIATALILLAIASQLFDADLLSQHTVETLKTRIVDFIKAIVASLI